MLRTAPTASDLADALAGASSIPGRAVHPSSTGATPVPGSPVARYGESSLPAASIVGLPPFAAPHAPVRWMPWAIGAGALVLVSVLAAKCSGPGNSPSGAMPSASPVSPPSRPDEPIRIVAPPLRSKKAEKDWDKLVDKLERGEIGEAREKLGDWERKHGATPETEVLRTQLENLPDHYDGRGRDD